MGAWHWPRGCVCGQTRMVSTRNRFCRGCTRTHSFLCSSAPGRSRPAALLLPVAVRTSPAPPRAPPCCGPSARPARRAAYCRPSVSAPARREPPASSACAEQMTWEGRAAAARHYSWRRGRPRPAAVRSEAAESISGCCGAWLHEPGGREPWHPRRWLGTVGAQALESWKLCFFLAKSWTRCWREEEDRGNSVMKCL